MKKNLSLLLVLFLSSLPLIAQNDLQWLIFKGKGKRGTIDATTNNYYYSFDAPADFNLEGIKHPDIDYYDYVRNDIFIIYADGTNFNSRLKVPSSSEHGFFYSSDLSILNHHFIPGHSSPISYMYLSNIYEQDDPPKNVRAKTGAGSGGSDSFTVPPVSTSSPTAIFADHDVVRNTDITIILDNTEIKSAAIDSGISVGTGFQYDLDLNYIQDVSDAEAPVTGEFFYPNPIFTKTTASGPVDVSIYPPECGEYLVGPNKIRIDLDCSSYTYVNLRPSSLLTDYYPGDDGEPKYKAIFSLTSTTGVPISSLNENIRDSHDPNFIRIDSICEDAMKNHIVYCHIEFENTSTEAPKFISVSFILPEGADTKCFEVMDWYLGKPLKKKGTVDRDGAKVKCHFNMEEGSISKCTGPDYKDICRGYINFKYKLGNMIPAENVHSTIFVKSPNVFFETQRYPVKRFEDLIDIEYHNQLSPIRYRPTVKDKICNIDCSGL